MKVSVMLMAVVMAVVICSTATAGVVSEDVAYWLNDGSTVWNPANPTEWSSQLVLKVQQTVFDNEFTRAITGLDTAGYLYSYSVTNLSYKLTESGLNWFEVVWPEAPTYVAISPQNRTAVAGVSNGWVASISGTNPSYHWQLAEGQPVEKGLMPGSTVTFWAVSEYMTDGHVSASAAGVAEPGTGYPYLNGETSGPCVPEPGALAGFASTVAGAAILAYRRRRS